MQDCRQVLPCCPSDGNAVQDEGREQEMEDSKENFPPMPCTQQHCNTASQRRTKRDRAFVKLVQAIGKDKLLKLKNESYLQSVVS